MAEYYGKPVRTHKFWRNVWLDIDACLVWKCGLPEDDPIHDHGE